MVSEKLLLSRVGLVKVYTEAIPTITDGRVFYISTQHIRANWSPPGRLSHVGCKSNDCTVHIVSEEMPTVCPSCGVGMEHAMIGHTTFWMECIYRCPKHPLKVWVDLFPKTAPDTKGEYFNAWLYRHKKDNLRSLAPLMYRMTPTGLIGLFPRNVIDVTTKMLARWGVYRLDLLTR